LFPNGANIIQNNVLPNDDYAPDLTFSPTMTMRQTLSYNPWQHLTPAGSVLAPMTQDEIQLYKTTVASVPSISGTNAKET
jgi:hypothetical protein